MRIIHAMSDSTREIMTWLETFEAACRTRDFDAARPMFAEDAVAFGTWARAVHGLASIEREQWRNVWPRIRDFRFEAPEMGVRGDMAWIAAAWTTEATGPDGRAFTRPGRGTFVLERRAGRWLAVHSHFSLPPTQSESAHGRRGSGERRPGRSREPWLLRDDVAQRRPYRGPS